MPDFNVVLPSKPKVISENDTAGVYEIEGFYPGYGHTIGNSLRRIILSSISGSAVTSVKIDGVSHEFSTIEGVKEDVISLLLNIKKMRFRMQGDEPMTARISVKGPKKVTSADIDLPGQIEIFDKNQYICEITTKGVELNIELVIEKGLGYVPKEVLHKDKVAVGTIALDATFTPIRRANYEVENMRVGDRTDFNRLRLFIETDGVITPREALEHSIGVMINQLKAIVGFKEEEIRNEDFSSNNSEDVLKMKIEDLGLPTRVAGALTKASIRTVGGLVRKSAADLLDLGGLGEKAVEEIRTALVEKGLDLKSSE